MGKFPFKRPRIISKKFPELDSSIDGVTKSLNDLVFSYHEQVGKALSKKHFLMAFSSIALLLVLGSFISMRGKADSSIFYPETCLGGWINPDNAQGEQQTTSNGNETQFTKENSAVLPKNTNAEMYCGNFKGKFDQTTKPTKIIVSLALTKGPELTNDDLFETGKKVSTTSVTLPEIASSTASSTLMLASSSEEILTDTTTSTDTGASTTAVGTAIATPGSQVVDASSIVEGVVESIKDTIRDIFNTSDETKTQTDTVVIPPSAPTETAPNESAPTETTPTEAAPAEQTPQDQAPAPVSDSPTSYLPLLEKIVSHFVGTVFAQEAEQSQVITEVTPFIETAPPVVTTEVTPMNETEANPLVDVTPVMTIETVAPTQGISESEKVLGVATTTEVMSATTTEVASTTMDVASTTSSDPNSATSTEVVTGTTTEDYQSQNNFLEIFYTFDGEVWKSLGTLNEISMKYRTFEIPITASTSWADMSKLQVKIEARKHEMDTPVVYLDGVKVEVLYETSLEHVHPDFARDTILKDETIGDMRIVTIINNDTNREEVWYMYLDDMATTTLGNATSTLEIATSTLASSTEELPITKNEETILVTSTSTNSATSTQETATSTATSTPFIKPVLQKNIWMRFDGKIKGMSGSQLQEEIKKKDESKLEKKDEDRLPDFAVDVIKRIQGAFSESVVVLVKKEGSDEIWLYNIEAGTQEKIQTGSTTSISSTYPLGSKGGNLFWLSNDESRVHAYNFETKIILQKIVPNFDGTKGERAEIIFEEIPWKVIVSTEGFSFFNEGAGEVFSDDNSTVVEAFRKKLKLDTVLDVEELDNLNLPADELPIDNQAE